MATQTLPAPNNKSRRSGKPSYRDYLTEEQVRRFMAVIKSPRDRAIFAVCYWRGLRASEIGLLPLTAYNPRAKTLVTRKGEVPLSRIEVRTLNAWLKVRDGQKPWQVVNNKPGAIFLSRIGKGTGKGIERGVIAHLMKKYGKLARLPRHLCRTETLRYSAEIHLEQRGIEVQQGFFAQRRVLAPVPISAGMRKRIRELERELDKLRAAAAEEAAVPSVLPKDPIAERAERRQALVMPILRRKNWKPGRLAIEAGVAKNSVYRYLDGSLARITDENRRALAEVLDIEPEKLPDSSVKSSMNSMNFVAPFLK